MKITFSFFLLFSCCSFAQDYRSGLILEYVSFNTNYTIVKYKKGLIADSSTEKRFLGGSYLSYSGKIDLGENFDLEFRSGIVLTSAQLGGIQLGIFIRKKIDNFFALAGYSWIGNLYTSHGMTNSETSTGDVYSLTIGAGYALSKRFNIMINYQKKFGDNFFGRGHNTDVYSSNSTYYNTVLNYIFTIGAEINLN